MQNDGDGYALSAATRQFLIDLLKQLEVAIPPPPNCHHVLSFAQYGDVEFGLRDELALQLNRAGTFHCLFLGPEDDNKAPSAIVADIVAAMSEDMPNVQYGIGPGQYMSSAPVTDSEDQ